MPKVSLDLTGKWEFKEYPLSARRMRDLDAADWQTTNVPCSIFNSLITADKIKQTDINTYPEKFSSVSERPWIYRKIFDAPAELLNCDRVDLVFDGLDTIANIWLNDKLIGKTNNMFIPFRFDVAAILKPTNNTLLVKFNSATEYAKRLMNRYTRFSESDFLNPHRVYIRKAQYQFGWDFCPSLPGCGIWRDVRLEGAKKALLEDLHIRTIDGNHHYADVKIAVKLDTVIKGEFLCRLMLTGDGKTTEHNLTFNPGEEFHSTVIRIENPLLWWPVGYGPQHLYQLDVQLLALPQVNGDELIDRTQRKFGIRTVKLNRSPDKHGEEFQFEVNGQPIYVRGANWIPASVFAGSATGDDYSKLLNAAAQANINMLRVWGGGYYETNEFYQLCDQLGIMVWQDFMFACAYYPDRRWFVEEVKTEATAIIKRLRNHPCLALWCGNNEIDWMHSKGQLGKSKKFYGKSIYHKLLPQLVAELDPDTDYIPTTPISISAKNPNDPNSGTIHQWNVWSGNAPTRQYISGPEDIPRFVTEFGLQSLPNVETIKTFCPPALMRIGGLAIEKHNYQLDGNSRLCRYISGLFGVAENPEQFVYLSQITQARAIKLYVEHLRAHNSKNNGVLFWQFNDCCPAISWSAMDYTKQPKALFYYAKRFFAGLLITVVPELDKAKANSPPAVKSLNVIVVNDTSEPLTATLNCQLVDLFGSVLDQVAFPIAIGPFSKSTALKLPKAISLPEHPDKSVLYLAIKTDGRKIAENLFLYLPDKYIDWPEVQISKRFAQITDRQAKLELKSNAIAKDIQISAAVPVQFSDNFIDLIPPDGLEITIDCKGQVAELESLIQLRSFKLVSE